MSTVNSQIVDSVADVVTLTTGTAPAQAFGMLDTVMVETLGMAMYNAVNRQQGASMISSAAVTAACAKMINANLPSPGIVPPAPPGPPHVDPLRPPPAPPEEFAQVASALAGAQSAIYTLKEEASVPGSPASGLAACGLSQISAETAPPSDYGGVANAFAAAEQAIAALKQEAAGTDAAVSALAQSSLARIELDAKVAPPPPVPGTVTNDATQATAAQRGAGTRSRKAS